jgi:plastocyanin
VTRGATAGALSRTFLFFAAASIGAIGHATTYLVTANPDITFTPAVITIFQRDKIKFQNAGGLHNVIADDGSFACGFNCNTNTAPSDRPWSYTISFNHVGTFGYYCEQHGNLTTGMRGTVIVVDAVFIDGFDKSSVEP